jgi:Cof subfamily protein (haloacid dehalogenase superfamily)
MSRPVPRPHPRTTAAELPILLLALDIDGTLIGHDLVLRERTIAAVRSAVRRGLRVSLVTGRMASSALPFADALGLTDPIVAYQGGLIREFPDGGSTVGRAGGRPVGRLLRHQPLTPDVARDAITWSMAAGLEAHINHLERFVIRADDPRADDYSAFLGARAELVPDLIEAVTKPVTKVIATAEEPRPMAVLDAARQAFAGRAGVTVSHPRFLEFVAPGVSKGHAIAWLARRAGIPLSQVMAIGDGLNDLEMLESAGHGVAMPASPPELRQAARYLAPPLEDEGAAVMIEQLVLAGRSAGANARRLAAEADQARADREAFIGGIP